EASSPIYVEGEKIKGKRVLAIEDGPTLTHGDMGYGAAVIASKHWGAAEIVDPRPYAVGTIKGVYEKFKHLNNVLPAMGYSPQQMEELKATIEATPCDIVVIGTPVDLSRFLKLSKPSVRIRYELEEKVGSLTELLEPVVKKGIEIRLKPALA
ncbi:MAG: GTPase, partial [Firmicutes bacterium]|nr:GTPase [Bacillota bacterium]